ncbi:MAG: hypothetical protein JEY91_19775 [Spirochaetaceae bacterium]|nr:hypothetical protein [Spirochaetaceae bacterium]
MSEHHYRKKIFFIYPNSYIRNEIIFPLIDLEYETYVIEDHKLIPIIQNNYSGSLLLINIDEKLTPQQWEKQILSTPDLEIGVMTYNENKNTELKYKSLYKISCGYNVLRKRPELLLENLIKTLDSFTVNEKRMFIRTRFKDMAANFELHHTGQRRTGFIHDISSIGMTLVFKKPLKIEKNSLLKDISLYIHESVIVASGIFMGASRNENDSIVYVILFDKTMKESSRSRIRLVINRDLQKKLINELKAPVP